MSMSSDEFVEAVRAKADLGQGYLETDTYNRFNNTYSSAHLDFYNVPKVEGRRGGGAVASNNRLLLFVDGFGREQGEPAKGKVKLRVAVAAVFTGAGLKRPRNKTATPEKMVDYVAKVISDAAKLEPRLGNPAGVATAPSRKGRRGSKKDAYFEKVGPMQWRIHVPGREPFDYYSYMLEDPEGNLHSESFTYSWEKVKRVLGPNLEKLARRNNPDAPTESELTRRLKF